MNNKDNIGGFTLVEILAVVTILAILLLVAVPNINNWIGYGRKKYYEAMKTTIIDATSEYLSSNKFIRPRDGEYRVICTDILVNDDLIPKLTDYGKKECDPKGSADKKSYVVVYRKNTEKTNYEYQVCLNCEGNGYRDKNEKCYIKGLIENGANFGNQFLNKEEDAQAICGGKLGGDDKFFKDNNTNEGQNCTTGKDCKKKIALWVK